MSSLPIIGGIPDFLRKAGELISPVGAQGNYDTASDIQQNGPGNFLRGQLPTLGAIAAPVGLDLMTGGTGIPADAAAAMGGYNVGRKAEAALGGPQYNPISPSNLLATGAIGATQGIGEGITKGVGTTLKNSADQAAINEFNPSTTVLKNFPKQTGMGFMDYLNKFKNDWGWDGKASTFKENVYDPLNAQYEENLKGQTIDPKAFKQSVQQRAQLLSKQGGISSNQTAQQLLAEYKDLMSKNKLNKPTSPIDAPLFNSYKSDLYDQGSKVDFTKPVAQRDGQLQLADIMKNHLNDVSEEAGGDLAQTGRDLNAAHTFKEAADNQGQLASAGRARVPGGLIGTGLRMAAEAGVGAALGHLIPGGEAIGAGLGPLVGESIMRNSGGVLPAIEGGLGKALTSNVGEKVLPALGAEGLHILGVGVNNNQENNQSQNSQNHQGNDTTNPEQNPPDIINDPARDKTTGHWSVPPDIPKFSVPAADSLMTIDQYKKAKDDYNKAISDHAGNPLYMEADKAWMQNKDELWGQAQTMRANALASKLPPEGETFMQQLPNDLEATNALRDILTKYGTATGVQNMSDAIKYAEAQHDPQVGVAQGIMNAKQAEATHQTLGRVSNFDINYLQNLPNPSQATNTALAQLDRAAKNDAIKARVYGGPYQYKQDYGVGNAPGITSGGLPAITNGTVPIQP